MIVCRHLVPTSGHIKESGTGEKKNATKHDFAVQNIVSQLHLKIQNFVTYRAYKFIAMLLLFIELTKSEMRN